MHRAVARLGKRRRNSEHIVSAFRKLGRYEKYIGQVHAVREHIFRQLCYTVGQNHRIHSRTKENTFSRRSRIAIDKLDGAVYRYARPNSKIKNMRTDLQRNIRIFYYKLPEHCAVERAHFYSGNIQAVIFGGYKIVLAVVKFFHARLSRRHDVTRQSFRRGGNKRIRIDAFIFGLKLQRFPVCTVIINVLICVSGVPICRQRRFV